MDNYCCDMMEYMLKRERVVFAEDEYYIIFGDVAEGIKANKSERLIYCPFCGEKLGGK